MHAVAGSESESDVPAAHATHEPPSFATCWLMAQAVQVEPSVLAVPSGHVSHADASDL